MNASSERGAVTWSEVSDRSACMAAVGLNQSLLSSSPDHQLQPAASLVPLLMDDLSFPERRLHPKWAPEVRVFILFYFIYIFSHCHGEPLSLDRIVSLS